MTTKILGMAALETLITKIKAMGKSPYIVIASETSSAKDKAAADYIIPNNSDFETSLQEAFGSLPSTGGQVYFCAGNYVRSESSYAEDSYAIINVPSNTTITGAGNAAKIQMNTLWSDNYLFRLDGVSNIDISGFYIGTDDYCQAININNSNNINISNMRFNLGGSDAYPAVRCVTSSYINVRNCTYDLYDMTQGVYMYQSTYCDVSDNLLCPTCDAPTIELNGGKYISVQRNRVVCTNSASGYITGIKLSNAECSKVTDNVFYANKDASTQIGIDANVTSASKLTYVVNNTYIAPTDGTGYVMAGAGIKLNFNDTAENWNRTVIEA